MNEQFSMIYTLLFLSAIIGSFAALKLCVEYWADYELFLINSNELISSVMLSDYFDAYTITLNFEQELEVSVNSSVIEIRNNNYLKQFNNSVALNDAELSCKEFYITKNAGGMSLT
ncbi:MAG: hypothetical protein WC376_04580 [Candidatus Nanoarchaeia archaeon]|jgi:hypothetical protein